ncbi:hypothetical protein, partial [Streptomyces sp. SID5770]|uniref:hypothetical protein n=1 Tax=Streptomyces sp. SID5770 TaxID=2690308 RepID=UPI001F19FE3B
YGLKVRSSDQLSYRPFAPDQSIWMIAPHRMGCAYPSHYGGSIDRGVCTACRYLHASVSGGLCAGLFLFLRGALDGAVQRGERPLLFPLLVTW